MPVLSFKNNREQIKQGHDLRKREARLAFWLLAPTLAIVLSIIVFPVVWNLWLSFKPVTLAQLRGQTLWAFDPTLNNYQKVLTDPDFFPALAITFSYALLGSLFSIILGLASSLIVAKPFRGRAFLRGIFISPYIAPTVAVAFTFSFILDPQMGVVNWWGIKNHLWQAPIAFFSQRTLAVDFLGFEFSIPLALSSVILFEAWRYFPFAFLFILARLQAIPEELDKAAQIDGASPLQRFFHITLPQLYPLLASLFLFRFIWAVNKFDDIFLLTRGQAGTNVIPIKIYDYAFGEFNIGASSALAMLLFLFLAVFLAIYLRWIVKETNALL